MTLAAEVSVAHLHHEKRHDDAEQRATDILLQDLSKWTPTARAWLTPRRLRLAARRKASGWSGGAWTYVRGLHHGVKQGNIADLAVELRPYAMAFSLPDGFVSPACRGFRRPYPLSALTSSVSHFGNHLAVVFGGRLQGWPSDVLRLLLSHAAFTTMGPIHTL